jgi:hypothetical protein
MNQKRKQPMKAITTRLDDELYDKFRKHLLKKSLENGHTINMDRYIRELITKDIDLPVIASETAPAKDTKSNQTLNLGDLFNL